MNENRKLIVKLIPYINASNPIRRKGIINMIRNIMLVDPMVYSLKKEREKDLEVIAISMDLILIITKYQTGRVILRKMNVYCVVRDMHMGLDDGCG